MYTDEQLAAMTPDQLKAAIKAQQVVPATLKEKFTVYAEKFLEKHGVSVQVATAIAVIAADAVYNMVQQILAVTLK